MQSQRFSYPFHNTAVNKPLDLGGQPQHSCAEATNPINHEKTGSHRHESWGQRYDVICSFNTAGMLRFRTPIIDSCGSCLELGICQLKMVNIKKLSCLKLPD